MSKSPDPNPPPKGKAPRQYSPEFRPSAAKLVLEEGKSRAEVARDLGISGSMIARWVEEAKRGGARPASAPSPAAREELQRLRRENKTLRMEREILEKAAAFFAKETT